MSGKLNIERRVVNLAEIVNAALEATRPGAAAKEIDAALQRRRPG